MSKPGRIFVKICCWISFILSACARQGFPPGGPEDRTPPKILEVTPKSDSTRVPLTVSLKFAFSEKVDRRSFEQAIFISPNPAAGEKKLRFRWRGERVEIIFPDSLRADRTYVVTLGTDVRDLRNNRLERAFSLAFSTGDSIDTGEIHGHIYHEKPAGVLILAYLLEAGREPNPVRDPAEYFTQAGSQGDFDLPYLSDGRYRLFALEDRDANRFYNRGEEPIGVATRDVVLKPDQRRWRDLNFRLALEDTVRPTLSSATATDQVHFELRFDEIVTPPDSLWPRHIRIVGEKGDSLQIIAAAPHPLEAQQIYALTSPQQAATYKIFFERIVDAAGNPLDSLSRQAEFAGNAKPDTTHPRLVRVIPADSSRDVQITTTVEMIFSEMIANSPMLIDKVQKKIAGRASPLAVQDSSGKPVAGKGIWLNPFQFRFQPDTLWQSRAKYVVQILADSTFDANGNALFDTTKKITFWTLNADTLTAISGEITEAQADATGAVHLTLRQLGAGSGAQAGRSQAEHKMILPAPGPYRFENILPGLYQLGAFRDANQNGRYDFGSPFPYVPAERSVVWPDTIKVRSRWPNEGNDFVLP